MAWRRPGDKPLSEPRMESLLTHICVTRPQWVNKYVHGCMYMWTYTYWTYAWLPTYKLYDIQCKYTNNILSTYLYTLQWLTHIMGARGAGNPIGFMGSLSETPTAYSPFSIACITLSTNESNAKWVDDFFSKAILIFMYYLKHFNEGWNSIIHHSFFKKRTHNIEIDL